VHKTDAQKISMINGNNTRMLEETMDEDDSKIVIPVTEVDVKDSEDSEQDDEEDEQGGESTHKEHGQNRRLKRLYMNRESARARRKRKKEMLATMEEQVADLTKQNQVYRLVNESLTTQVQQLESDLALANANIVLLRSGGSNGGSAMGSHAYRADGLGSPNDSMHRLLASPSRHMFHSRSASATSQDFGLFHGVGHDVLLQRQRERELQLAQLNADSVLASLLQQQHNQQQQHQQPSSLAIPTRFDQQMALSRVSRRGFVWACLERTAVTHHSSSSFLASARSSPRLSGLGC
jgi:hypothetical protein